MCGVCNEVIQSKLLTETDLTLDKTTEIVVALETAEHNTHELHQSLNRTEDASSLQWMDGAGSLTHRGGRRAVVDSRRKVRNASQWKK